MHALRKMISTAPQSLFPTVLSARLISTGERQRATLRWRGSRWPKRSITSSAPGLADAKLGVPRQRLHILRAGQVLMAKIANVKVYAEASRDSKVVATLQRSDELVASGEVKNGFVQVDSANFSGWVQRTLVNPR